ncbi:YqaE/Pmp3 family membrane protein [Nonlabens sp.]|uniref:YqaE/Pmp3 family membrane protein n=1 Tax=Nonlabens sp. TaxID=1888209 RepID=UPI003F6A21F1
MKPLTIFLNLFLPPISVFRKRGIHNDLAINIILTILFFFPGVLHAFYITSKRNQIL